MKTSAELRKAIKILNDQQERHAAGFYPSTGGRAFMARLHKGEPQISYDFESFVPVDLESVTFTDHNGRGITLFPKHR